MTTNELIKPQIRSFKTSEPLFYPSCQFLYHTFSYSDMVLFFSKLEIIPYWAIPAMYSNWKIKNFSINLGWKPRWNGIYITGSEKTSKCPGWCSSVDWAQACEPKGYQLDSQSRAHAWVAGRVPSRGHMRGNHTLMLLSLSFSFPSPLPKNK